MIINRKIKRTMLEGKSQYLGSVVLIIISCLLFTMLNLLSTNMKHMTSSFEKDYVQEDASLVAGNKINDIQALESKFNARIEEGAAFDYEVSEGKTLRIFSENVKVNIPAVIEGEKIAGNDILLDPAFAKANKLKIGDQIQILDKTFKIAGFMSLPNYIYPLKTENDILTDPASFGIAVIGKDDFDKFNKGNSFYSIKFNPDNGNIEAQGSEFRDYLKEQNIIISQWNDISENKRVTYVSTKIEGISQMSTSMPIAILLLTCILSGIVIMRMLKRESVIIGTLYAQGYRRKEIRRHYLFYPLSIALAGGIIGTILGALFLRPMLEFMVSYFNMPIGSIDFSITVIAASLLLPVLFLCFSGHFVLNKVLKFSPVDLMKGVGESSKVNFLERKLTLDRFKFSTKFKLREQLRSLSRLTFLLVGVVMATMLLLLGFTAKSSLDYLMNDSIKNTFKFQHEYVFSTLQEGQIPAGSEAFSASIFTLKSDDKKNFEICGVNSDSQYISVKNKKGDSLTTDQVIITKPLAEKLKVDAGDTVQVINKLDSREYKVTIDSIAETYAGEYVFMPLSQFNEMLGFPSESYIGLWSNDSLNIPDKSLYGSRTMEDSVKAFNATLEPMQSTLGVISFMAFIIGLVVIYVVTSLIIEENKENISLMKVFGYRRKEVNSLILNSSSMVIIAGYVIGIPLILISMDALFRSLTESVDLAMPVTISYPYILVGFVVVYLTYELSKVLSRRKVDSISMSEALKSGME